MPHHLGWFYKQDAIEVANKLCGTQDPNEAVRILYVEKKWSAAKIAKAFEKSQPHTILKRLRKMGVEIRGQGSWNKKDAKGGLIICPQPSESLKSTMKAMSRSTSAQRRPKL